jgi:hypothetical protein
LANRQQTHIDQALTQISVAYIQNASVYIADKVFPIIPVQKQSDRYFMYKKEDWFRDDAEERALGTESAGGDYDIDNTPTYFCRKFAYHKDVFEEDRVNSDDPLTPDTDATDFVTDKLLLRREIAWANRYFVTGVWGVEYTGNATTDLPTKKLMFWNDTQSDPIGDIARAATDIQELTGKRPNKLVIGQRVFDALKNHPDILDRIKYTEKGIVTVDLLASLFDVQQVLVAGAIKNTAAKGQDAAMSFIFGKSALLCYTATRPSLKTATAGYIFAWKGLLGSNAYGGRILRIPVPLLGEGTERIEGEMAWDMKVVAADLGTFYNGIVQ